MITREEMDAAIKEATDRIAKESFQKEVNFLKQHLKYRPNLCRALDLLVSEDEMSQEDIEFLDEQHERYSTDSLFLEHLYVGEAVRILQQWKSLK